LYSTSRSAEHKERNSRAPPTPSLPKRWTCWPLRPADGGAFTTGFWSRAANDRSRYHDSRLWRRSHRGVPPSRRRRTLGCSRNGHQGIRSDQAAGGGLMSPALEVVGRESEIDAVRAFLEAVPAGPIALLIEGAIGIG